MTKPPFEQRGLPVPRGRLSRLARFGGLTGRVLGTMAVSGGRQIASGQRPDLGRLLLTPGNAARITNELAQMRGAAMKVGQLISMEAGDLVPPDVAEMLAHLRSDAHFMPPKQLKTTLVHAWGPDFMQRFERFDVRPIAAASIGQVHRATTAEGQDLAIKVQYPGVRRSIDSDLRNVGALLRMSGMVPRGLDIGPLLDEARRQLHEEADYDREGQALARFGGLLSDAPDYHVPRLHAGLTTRDVLAMSFARGTPIEELHTAPQQVRDRAVRLLIDLVLRELFEFHLMQTDPNFANYRYDAQTGKVVLLDFGATRAFGPQMAAQYRTLMRAGVAGDRQAVCAAALDIGFITTDTRRDHVETMLDMFDMAMEPLRKPTAFDFGASDLAARLRDRGLALGMEREFDTVPPMNTLFLQRKIAGMYLLASRLRARVAIAPLIAPWM